MGYVEMGRGHLVVGEGEGEGEEASYGKKTVKVCFLKVLNEGQEIVPGNIHRFERQFETFHAFHTRAG